MPNRQCPSPGSANPRISSGFIVMSIITVRIMANSGTLASPTPRIPIDSMMESDLNGMVMNTTRR
jgi:hypothetical protein